MRAWIATQSELLRRNAIGQRIKNVWQDRNMTKRRKGPAGIRKESIHLGA